MAPPLVELKPLPFREAIAALGRRTGNLKPSDRWTDRMHDEHAGEFTVARSLGYDILGDIEAAMNKALAEGTTLADFSKTLTPVLKAKGWWGKVESDDGTVVQLGSQRRLETIFNTNMRTSYAAGRWEQIQRTKADLPYLMYSAVLDKRTRPAHRSWHGTVLHVDDPWWDVHYPPCGWNCRCTVIQLTRRQAERRGITKTPPSGPPRRWFNPSSGQTIEVPHGIDPGWGYNPGKAAETVRFAEQAAVQLAQKLIATPAEIAAVPLTSAIIEQLTVAFGRWLRALDLAKPAGDMRVVGTLNDDVLKFVQTPERGLDVGSGAITITDKAVAHILRDAKGALAPSMDTMARLPELLAKPAAILWDKELQNLVYIVEESGDRGTRFAVAIGRAEKVRDAAGKRASIQTNSIFHGQRVGLEAYGDRRHFQLIAGSL